MFDFDFNLLPGVFKWSCQTKGSHVERSLRIGWVTTGGPWNPASWEPTDDGALGKAPFLQQDIYKKESIDNPVERGVQSKRGWSAVFSQEVKGKPLSRDYSSVYANVKHQKMKVHWGGLVLELSNTSLNNYLAHFRILKVVYKSKIVLVARWTIYVLI